MVHQAILELKNYGPFKSARLEISKLTVIVGRNSTGKSLLAYTYVALSRAFNPVNLMLYSKPEGSLEDFNMLAKRYLNKALSSFTGRRVQDLVNLNSDEAFLSLKLEHGSIDVILTKGEGIKDIKLGYSGWMKKVSELFIEALKRGLGSKTLGEVLEKLTISTTKEEASKLLLEISLAPIVLVDSRSGIVKMLSKLQPYASLVALQRMDLDLELALYIQSLTSALESEEVNLDVIKPLLDSLGITEIKSIGREVILKLFTGVYHSLANAPSGVRESLPLVLALATKSFKEMVIEEPEAHLHPKAIKTLARALARAINEDKQIIITTHSDLLLASINNLIMLHNNPRKASELGFEDKDLIDYRNVAAYVTRAVKDYVELEKLKVDESGIAEEEFEKVVHEIADERAEALT